MPFLPSIIAWRYIVGTKRENTISIMALLCFFSIFIASCALTLVLSIMQGFEEATHKQLQGIHAPIIMESAGNTLEEKKITDVLNKEFPEVAAFSPHSTKQVIIQNPVDSTVNLIVTLKGIDPQKEHTVSSIAKKIIDSKNKTHNLTSLLAKNSIIIGEKLSRSLNIGIGDTLDILYQDNTKNDVLRLEKTTVTIAGIFKTGIEEYDYYVIYSSLSFMNKIFHNDDVERFSIKLHPQTNESDIISKLKKRFGLDVYSWQELYPALVSALLLEKYAMGLILSLIVLVASMSIISLLFMQIIQKYGDIAILKAMGMPTKNVKQIFMYMGVGIATISTICGLLLALIVGVIIKKYKLIALPDTYYVSYLPITFNVSIFVSIFILVLLLSILATWLPVRRINKINIANILRYEA